MVVTKVRSEEVVTCIYVIFIFYNYLYIPSSVGAAVGLLGELDSVG